MINIKNLGKSFDEKTIFSKFNCEIESDEMVAIMGKSGSGKSTLLNIIGLLEPFSEGEVILNNCPIMKLSEKRRSQFIRDHISYLFQNYALIEDDTVTENLMLALEYVKSSKKEKHNMIHDALNTVGLQAYQNRKIYTLSGGEQQRVALARTILKPSNIILADEPTGNLDEENKKDVMTILSKIRETGKTILIVTHDYEVAKKCDRIVTIN